MSNYVYAVAYDDNVMRSISPSSIRNAEDKIIDKFRDDYEIEKEFNNYREFKDYMWDNYEVLVSNPQDIEAL